MQDQDPEVQLEFDLGTSAEAGKEQRLEEAKANILNSVASAKLDTLQERVAWILNNYPKARNSDIALQLIYWRRFESDICTGNFVDLEDLYRLTRLTSLQRARAKIQNTYKLFQADLDVRRRRGKLEESEKEKAVEQQPSFDEIYVVYADESGKNQDHLVVGSVWFLHAPETVTVNQEIEACKKRRSFDGELHFKKITKSNLPVYKEVADVLAAKSSTVSFKAISVKRQGIARVDNALIDLYYLLLVNGVEHENDSGRAPLPRMLQLWKDAEQEGYDGLLFGTIKDRLAQASNALFENKLKPDHFEAVDSASLSLIQIADLFTSSIGRKLNATGARSGAKDELADYLLRSVGMPDGPLQSKKTGDRTYYLGL